MKRTIQVGDRVQYKYGVASGVVLRLLPDESNMRHPFVILSDITGDKKQFYDNGDFTISSSGYEDFQERIKERIKV